MNGRRDGDLDFEHRLTRVEVICWVNLVLSVVLSGKEILLKLIGG
jgi:hypothetical protein